MIKIISDGLNYGGAPLMSGQVKNFDAATEAAYVATGKAIYLGKSCFGGVNAIGQQHAAVSAPANTSENTLYSLNIPGGTLGPNDSLRVTSVWTMTNSANNKTVNTKLGGSNIGSVVNTAVATYKEQRQVSNRGVQNSQVAFVSAFGGLGQSSVAVSALSIDTTKDQLLTVTGTKATAGETLTLESVLVEVINAATPA